MGKSKLEFVPNVYSAYVLVKSKLHHSTFCHNVHSHLFARRDASQGRNVISMADLVKIVVKLGLGGSFSFFGIPCVIETIPIVAKAARAPSCVAMRFFSLSPEHVQLMSTRADEIMDLMNAAISHFPSRCGGRAGQVISRAFKAEKL